MGRRDKDLQRGYINFPITDPRYTHTGEGGMFVRLVVSDPSDLLSQDWMLCCGGYNQFLYDESLLNYDLEKKYFPNLNREGDEELGEFWYERYISQGELAIITIGSTGWSGYDGERREYWKATYEDLTEEGKALWALLEKLYPNCEIALSTWLDT